MVGGHSLGGRVALAFSAFYPEIAAGLIMVAGPHMSNFYQTREAVQNVYGNAYRTMVSPTEFASRAEALAVIQKLDSDQISNIAEYELPLSRIVAQFDVDTDRYELNLLRVLRLDPPSPERAVAAADAKQALTDEMRSDVATAGKLLEHHRAELRWRFAGAGAGIGADPRCNCSCRRSDKPQFGPLDNNL